MSQFARMNPGDSVTDLSPPADRRQGRRLLSELRRPWRDPGGFDDGDVRCVKWKNQTTESRTAWRRNGRMRANKRKRRGNGKGYGRTEKSDEEAGRKAVNRERDGERKRERDGTR